VKQFTDVISICFLYGRPRLFSEVEDWMSTTWCGLSANLECMSEMCCMRLAENMGRKNYAKNRTRTIAQLCRTIYSQLRHVSTIGENLLNNSIFCTSAHNMVNFDLLTAEIGWRVRGTPANFNRFRVLASLLHPRRSTEVNQTSHDVWPSPEQVHYIYTLGALVP